MASFLRQFAAVEKNYLINEIKWLQIGGKVVSPSGEDFTDQKLQELTARLNNANRALREADRITRQT